MKTKAEKNIRLQQVPSEPDKIPDPEIPPTREPHIDFPETSPPTNPTPERPVPVKAPVALAKR